MHKPKAASSATAALQEKDRRWLHPWDRPNLIDDNARTVFHQADGHVLSDTDGHDVIDGPGGMWCMNLGHGVEEIADAMAEQARRLAYSSPWGTANPPSAILAETLAGLAPGDLDRVFFTTGGSTANDSALRFVAFYNNVLGRPEKKLIVSRQNAYHGSTLLTASVSGKERDKSHLDTLSDQVIFLSSPNPYRRPKGVSESAFCDMLVEEFRHTVATVGADRIAAYIAEPVLASGGVIVPPEGYNRRMWEVCRANDIIYISDEVVTAFGRLGHMFASHAVYGFVPDIITCAKGLTAGYAPLGAAIVSERLFANLRQVCGDDPGVIFANGYTYSGHPVACAAALKTIEILQRDDVLGHVRRVAPRFQARLRTLLDLPLVGDVRGTGLMAAVEATDEKHAPLEKDKEIGEMIDTQCQKLGLLVRPIVNLCVLSPPLTVTGDDVDDIVQRLRRGIELAWEELVDRGVVTA